MFFQKEKISWKAFSDCLVCAVLSPVLEENRKGCVELLQMPGFVLHLSAADSQFFPRLFTLRVDQGDGHEAKVIFVPAMFRMNLSGMAFSNSMMAFRPVQWQGII